MKVSGYLRSVPECWFANRYDSGHGHPLVVLSGSGDRMIVWLNDLHDKKKVELCDLGEMHQRLFSPVRLRMIRLRKKLAASSKDSLLDSSPALAPSRSTARS